MSWGVGVGTVPGLHSFAQDEKPMTDGELIDLAGRAVLSKIDDVRYKRLHPSEWKQLGAALRVRLGSEWWEQQCVSEPTIVADWAGLGPVLYWRGHWHVLSTWEVFAWKTGITKVEALLAKHWPQDYLGRP